MINYIIVSGTCQELLDFELPSGEDEVMGMVGNEWMTNCMGIDFTAICLDTQVSEKDLSTLMKKFRSVDVGVYYQSMKREYQQLVTGCLQRIQKFSEDRDHRVNDNQYGIFESLGVRLNMTKFVEQNDQTIHQLVKLYSGLRTLNYNFLRPDEFVYFIDASQHTLRDLPDIHRTSKIILHDAKKLRNLPGAGARTPNGDIKFINSQHLFTNDTNSIIVAHTWAIIKLVNVATLVDTLTDVPFVNSQVLQEPMRLLKLLAKLNNLNITDIGELINNDYHVTS